MGLNVSYKRLRCKGSCGRHKLLELLVTTEEGSYTMDEADLSGKPGKSGIPRGDNTQGAKAHAAPSSEPSQNFWEPEYEIVEWQGTPDTNAQALDSICNRKTLALPDPGGPRSILNTKV